MCYFLQFEFLFNIFFSFFSVVRLENWRQTICHWMRMIHQKKYQVPTLLRSKTPMLSMRMRNQNSPPLHRILMNYLLRILQRFRTIKSNLYSFYIQHLEINPVSFNRYTWRIDLAKSEEFWSGWFSGLSEMFLELRVPKLLLLASIDGLDRTLTVGQMQGKS